MTDALKKFLDPLGGLECPNLKYRPGAQFTSLFGLGERYRIIDGKQYWGWPGIHDGVDRGGSGVLHQGHQNGIFAPFNFSCSWFVDYNGKDYGSMVFLYHDAGFVVKIAHMYPEKIAIMPLLKEKKPIPMGTFIGTIGSNGNSTAPHSHTEIEAWSLTGWAETCPILDEILFLKFDAEASHAFNGMDVVSVYRKINKTQTWNNSAIEDFDRLCAEKQIIYINEYKYIKTKTKGSTTLYSSKALFGM